MAKPKDEKTVSKETAQERFARERAERDREAYRRYWLTLDPRDRERVPRPDSSVDDHSV